MRGLCKLKIPTDRIFFAATLICSNLAAGILAGQDGAAFRQIEAGTKISLDVDEQARASRWNRIVLLARPRIASGDFDALPKSIRDTVSKFVLSILATVESYQEAGQVRYRLLEVGAGFSTEVDGKLTVLTPDTQRKLGAGLGFFERQLLKTNQEQIDTVRFVARTSTLFVFDTPTLMLRENKHQDFVTRHFVWLDNQNGKTSALLWLLAERPNGELSVVDEPMRWIPAGSREDRRIHVDGSEFMLGGIPTERAFALEDMAPGREIPWLDSAKDLAAQTSFDEESFRKLTLALNQCLQALR